MRPFSKVRAVALVWGLLIVAGGVLADTSPLARRLDLDARNAPLRAVAEALTVRSGTHVDVHASVADRRISLTLSDVPLGLALQILAEATGLQVGQHDKGYLLRLPADTGSESFRLMQPGELAVYADRAQVAKVNVPCDRVSPSAMAAYFGRPGLKQGPGGLVLEQAAPPTFALAHTALMAGADGRAAVLCANAQRCAADRWGQVGAGSGEPAVRLPVGMLGVIGWDPASKVVAVGRPEAVEQFQRLVGELDAPTARLELQATYYLVDADRLATSGLNWEHRPSATAGAVVRLATGAADEVANKVASVGGKPAGATGPLAVSTAAPVVLSVSRWQAGEGNLAGDVATTDLKVVGWTVGDGADRRIALQLDPVLGCVCVDLHSGDGNTAAELHTDVPRVGTEVRIAPGQAVALDGFLPTGDLRASEAGPLLANLPLVGDLYRMPGAASTAQRVVVVVTARVVGD